GAQYNNPGPPCRHVLEEGPEQGRVFDRLNNSHVFPFVGVTCGSLSGLLFKYSARLMAGFARRSSPSACRLARSTLRNLPSSLAPGDKSQVSPILRTKPERAASARINMLAPRAI